MMFAKLLRNGQEVAALPLRDEDGMQEAVAKIRQHAALSGGRPDHFILARGETASAARAMSKPQAL